MGLPDGDAAARALKQNLMRLYNKSLDLLPQHIVSLMGSDLPPPQADAVLEFAKKKSQVRDKAMLQSIDDPDLPELAPKNEDEISEFLPITMRNDERQFSVRIEDDTALYWHASEDADPQRIDSIDAVADGAGHKFVKIRRAVVQMRLNVKTNFRAKKSRSVLLLREPRLIIKAVALQLQPAEALSGMGAADEPPPKRLCFWCSKLHLFIVHLSCIDARMRPLLWLACAPARFPWPRRAAQRRHRRATAPRGAHRRGELPGDRHPHRAAVRRRRRRWRAPQPSTAGAGTRQPLQIACRGGALA